MKVGTDQVEQVVCPICLAVDSPARAGGAYQVIFAQPGALVEVPHAARLEGDGVTASSHLPGNSQGEKRDESGYFVHCEATEN